MIPILGKQLALFLGKLLILSVAIFLVLKTTGAYVETNLSYLEFLRAAFSGRMMQDASLTGLPPLRPAFLYTASTLLAALLLSYGFGLPLGYLLGQYRALWVQAVGHALVSVALAIPAFWVAYVVLYYSINEWGIFIGGEPRMEGDGWWSALIAKSLILAVPLSLSGMAYLTQQISQSLARAFPTGTSLHARAQGITETAIFEVVSPLVVWRPALRALPYLSSVFLSVLIAAETAFFVPGFGYFLFKTAQESDVRSLAVLSLWVTVGLLFVNFLVDLVIEVFDAKQPSAVELGA